MAYKIKTKQSKHDYKSFKVNFNNLKSMKKAENIKAKLENGGYNQVSMTPIGYDKFILVYKK